MPTDHLGEFEQLVLLSVLRLGDRAYGVPIRQEIEQRARRKVTIGALYATLDRLEAKGYLRTRGSLIPRRAAAAVPNGTSGFSPPVKQH